MWRKLVVAGTIAVVLAAGTAIAFASQGDPATPGSPEGTPANHWTEMSVEMGDQWPAMVDHMQEVLGDQFSNMVDQMQSMEPFGIDMDGRGMWNDDQMGSYGPGTDGRGMWNDDQMGSYGSGMGGGFGGMNG